MTGRERLRDWERLEVTGRKPKRIAKGLVVIGSDWVRLEAFGNDWKGGQVQGSDRKFE